MIRFIAAGLLPDNVGWGLLAVGIAIWAGAIAIILLMIRGGTQGRDHGAHTEPPGIAEDLEDVEIVDPDDEKDHSIYWG